MAEPLLPLPSQQLGALSPSSSRPDRPEPETTALPGILMAGQGKKINQKNNSQGRSWDQHRLPLLFPDLEEEKEK